MSSETAPDASATLNEQIPQLVLRTGIPGRHSARSALRHLEKARLLSDTDMEMAAFRALTAEEEAATALIHALRRNRYVGAERLDPRSHVHKRACIPFLDAVGRLLGEAQEQGTFIVELAAYTETESTPLKLRLWHPSIPIGKRLSPEPPLDFTFEINDKLAPFHDELKRIATASGASQIRDYLQTLANHRNELLYASQEGVPQVTTLGNLLTSQTQKVNRLLLVYLLVDQVRRPQLFVTQCLTSFLRVLGILEQESNGA